MEMENVAAPAAMNLLHEYNLYTLFNRYQKQ